MDTLGDRVRTERKALKLSQGQLAAKVTKAGFPIGQTGISNIEHRGDTSPQCIYQLALALDVSVEWLQTGKGPKVVVGRGPAGPLSLDIHPEIPGLPDLHARATGRFGVWWFQEKDTNYDGSDPLPKSSGAATRTKPPRLPKDVPVYHADQIVRIGARRRPSAADLAGVTLGETVVGFTYRPPHLFGRDDVFCIETPEDSLYPWREPGEPIYIDQKRPPRLGSHALLKLKWDDESADEDTSARLRPIVIARITSATETTVKIRLYTPFAEFDVAREDIVEMLRVFEWHELLLAPDE